MVSEIRVQSVFHPLLKHLNFHAKLKNSYFLTRKSVAFVAAVPPVATVFDGTLLHDKLPSAYECGQVPKPCFWLWCLET
jgi:hypothetical protein